MNVTAQAGQQIIPKFTATVDLHINKEKVRLPLLVVDAKDLNDAARRIELRSHIMEERCGWMHLEIIEIKKGAWVEPLAEANTRIVADFLAKHFMQWINA